MTIPRTMELALEQHRAGRLPEAEALYRQVLAQDANHPDALNLMGVLAGQVGRHEVAVEFLSRAITASPRMPQFYLHMGVSLDELGRHEQAIAAYRAALSLRADYPQALCNLGNTLWKIGKTAEAIELQRAAIAKQPDLAPAHTNLGNELKSLGQLPQAEVAFRQAMILQPGSADAVVNLAVVLAELGYRAEATEGLEHAVNLAPGSAEAHWNLGLMRLMAGDFERGWEEYEWRFGVKAFSGFAGPSETRWHGEDLAGRRIALHAEQGLGDVIQFMRYVPLVAERGGRVVVVAHRPLQGLVMQMADVEWAALDEPFPAHDVHCPLMSLPGIFGTTIQTIPAGIPYFRADEERMAQWKSRIPADARRKIGLAWAGSAKHHNDRNRSIPPADLTPLLDLDGVQWFSLQKDAQAPARVINWTGELSDFADTAALIAHLDLVITVDTAVAHLAGAMGKPVWVLLPYAADWRWMLDRSDSPWYPSMKLFRQKTRGDWKGVIEEVVKGVGGCWLLVAS